MRGALLLAVALGACADDAPLPRTSRAEVSRDAVVLLAVSVELALTAGQRMTGLRGRTSLPPGEGLALLFAVESEICLVNDGVPFPIDALYADEDGTIVAVERLEADDPTAICHATTQSVLELAAGVADPVAVGDQLTITP